MPFTPAHAIAVVPIAAVDRAHRLPISALAIGSMIPDTPMFVLLPVSYSQTHSLPGLITGCLPLGLVAFALYHLLLKRPLFALLPVSIQSRCASLLHPAPAWSLARLAAVFLAIVIGSAIHVFWDTFTHAGRFGSLLFPWLDHAAFTIGRRGFPWYEVLQYLSSSLGLLGLALVAVLWLRRQPVTPPQALPPGLIPALRYLAYGLYLAIPLAILALFIRRHGRFGLYTAFEAVTWSGLVLALLTLAYSLAYHTVHSNAAHAPSRLGAD